MLNKLLNIKYPILQGAMANISKAPLVSAVSNAGGLGIIASGNMSKDELDKEIKKTKELTDKPFGVNLMLMMDNIEELVDVIIKNNVPVVTTGAGSPKNIINKLKANNIKVIPVIANPKQAIKMEEIGADAVIAEGTEAGGHIGKTGEFALLQNVINSVNIPVIAAGGVYSGKSLASVCILGAAGAQIGTRFLLSKECPIHDNYKIMVKDAKETIVTGTKNGTPVRVIPNKISNKYLELEDSNIDNKELEKLMMGSLTKAVNGDKENGSFMAGDIVYSINELKNVEEIIKDIINEYNYTLDNVNNIRISD